MRLMISKKFPVKTKITWHIEWSDPSGNWAKVSDDFVSMEYAVREIDKRRTLNSNNTYRLVSNTQKHEVMEY